MNVRRGPLRVLWLVGANLQIARTRQLPLPNSLPRWPEATSCRRHRSPTAWAPLKSTALLSSARGASDNKRAGHVEPPVHSIPPSWETEEANSSQAAGGAEEGDVWEGIATFQGMWMKMRLRKLLLGASPIPIHRVRAGGEFLNGLCPIIAFGGRSPLCLSPV